MGKPGSSPLLRPDADAMSLHSQHGDFSGPSGEAFRSSANSLGSSRRTYLDADDDAPELFLDNDDELPPLYSDVVSGDLDREDNAADSTVDTAGTNGTAGRNYARFRYPSSTAAPQKWRYAIDPLQGTNDTKQMISAVKAWARIPPRPYVQLRGTHTQEVENKGKKENREVVDFDVKVELTPYLYSNVLAYESWSSIETPEDHEKVRRGTVFRCQAPGVAGRPQLPVDVEQGMPGEGESAKPTVEEWCRRYCEDPSPLRSFTLERYITGFDYKKVRGLMEVLVRRTNYKGHLVVSFPTDEVGLVYYSQHRFNQWRIQRWIQILCTLTLMILFTWPYLFFRTKQYEVVKVQWPFSRYTPGNTPEYASLTEDQWYNMWGRAITKAVLGKRQATLDQKDLREAEGAEATFQSTGNTTVDGALGFVQAGINAMNQVNRQLGWGYDC